MVNKHQMHSKKTKMIYLKSKAKTSKSSEQQDLENLLLKLRGKLCNPNGIKAMNHKLILSGWKEGKPKSNARNTIQGDSTDTEPVKYNTNGIKTGSSKNIDLLKVKRRHS